MKVRIKKGKGDNLTKGKWYDAIKLPTKGGVMFTMENDRGAKLFCLEKGCAHLGRGNWEVKESNDVESNDGE